MSDSPCVKLEDALQWYFSNENYQIDSNLRAKLSGDGLIAVSDLIASYPFNKLNATAETVAAAVAEFSSSITLSSDGTRIGPTQRWESVPFLGVAMHISGFTAATAPAEAVKVIESTGATAVIPRYTRFTETVLPLFSRSCYAVYPDQAAATAAADTAAAAQLTAITRQAHIEQQMIARGNAKGLETMSGKKYPVQEYMARSVLVIEGIGSELEVSREVLAEVFAKFGKISFISYVRNQESAEIRFSDIEVADAACAATNGVLELGGKVVKTRVMSEDEETAYYKQILRIAAGKEAKSKAQKGQGKKRYNRRR
ncbi:RNA binding motif [Carpediemonas membranifera]|uniref:RNA binding motif n=1 Tax=Carpediemonas membranifera TaxID=201153 RepID=A0A8J6ATQ3_9EUKA|nr:RNA binding motif [Carpediemonas membranifera]|eukprot:KAG9392180.1 RNA binding motif [Carpediemonas membranifera]